MAMSKGKNSRMNTSFGDKEFSGSNSSEDEPNFLTQSINLNGDEDISKEWVNECTDLREIAMPIPLDMIKNALDSRDIEMEFRILIRITETNHHTKKIVDYCPNMIKKNRYSNVLPCR